MAFVASLAGGIGGILEGVGGIVQAKNEERLGQYNATIYEQQATASRKSQELLEFQKRKIIQSRIGEQVAAVGKSGLRYSGSPVEVALDSLTNAEMDIQIDKYNSEIEARGYESSAAMSRYEGRQAAAAQYSRAGKSFLSVASSFASEIGGGGKNIKGKSNAQTPKN